VCLSWFKETGGLHSVRRARAPTSIHLLKMCQKPNEGSTSLNACDATLQKIKKYSHYYQFVMPLVEYYILSTIVLIGVI
jgi:hypothetical protein